GARRRCERRPRPRHRRLSDTLRSPPAEGSSSSSRSEGGRVSSQVVAILSLALGVIQTCVRAPHDVIERRVAGLTLGYADRHSTSNPAVFLAGDPQLLHTLQNPISDCG